MHAMTSTPARHLKIPVGGTHVSGLLIAPERPRACYVLAHGAGVGMQHSFMAAVADGLSAHQVATLRYNFPYMEQGRRQPDSPKAAQLTVRAAVNEASHVLPGIPSFAGGKSYGARMTSQAQAEVPLPHVRGLVFLGFPLHPPGQPSANRAEHLSSMDVPMLFLQGARDEFADLDYLKPLVKHLGANATLNLFDHADHSFHVPAKSGRTDAEVMTELLDEITAWIDRIIG